MIKTEKVESIATIKKAYEKNAKGGAVIFAEYQGLRVEDMFKLRRSGREKAVQLNVFKNTLVRRALSESGVNGLESFLTGPIVTAFSPDEVSAPKVLAKFAKELDDLKLNRRLIIRGGVLDGKAISAKDVANLATLPSREEVFAKLLAMINAPATSLLRLIQEPAARTVRVIQASTENK